MMAPARVLHVANGMLMVPIPKGWLGIPLWFIGLVIVGLIGLIVAMIVILSAVSKKRRDDNS